MIQWSEQDVTILGKCWDKMSAKDLGLNETCWLICSRKDLFFCGTELDRTVSMAGSLNSISEIWISICFDDDNKNLSFRMSSTRIRSLKMVNRDNGHLAHDT